MSIDCIRSRYNRLRKEGIIVSASCVFNPKAFGFDSLSWLGISTQPGSGDDVLKFLKEKPQILESYPEMGKYDIRSLLQLKRMGDLAGFVDSIKKHDRIKDIDVMIWCEIEKMAYPENLVIEPYPEKLVTEPFNRITNQTESLVENNYLEQKVKSSVDDGLGKKNNKIGSEAPRFDKIDRAIIGTLSIDVRTPFSAIAKKLGVSTKTVIRRCNKIKKEWEWYSTLSLNLKKLGYSSYISYLIKVSSKSWVMDIFEKLTTIPNIIAVLKLLGPYDINALAPMSNLQQPMEYHQKIAGIPGIEKIDYQYGCRMPVWPPSPPLISSTNGL